MKTAQIIRKQQADKLYDQYVRPLERKFEGKYVTVNLFGDKVISSTLLEALQKADEVFGRKQTITFKVGEKVVGKLR